MYEAGAVAVILGGRLNPTGFIEFGKQVARAKAEKGHEFILGAKDEASAPLGRFVNKILGAREATVSLQTTVERSMVGVSGSIDRAAAKSDTGFGTMERAAIKFRDSIIRVGNDTERLSAKVSESMSKAEASTTKWADEEVASKNRIIKKNDELIASEREVGRNYRNPVGGGPGGPGGIIGAGGGGKPGETPEEQAKKASGAWKAGFGTLATMGKWATLSFLGIGAISVKWAADFQRQMELLHTQAGVAQKDLAGIHNELLKMAGEVGYAPEALAKALYHIESGGIHGAKALHTLRLASEGAQVGQANLEDTASALTAILRSAPKDVHGVSQAMGMMNDIVGKGNMRLEDLNKALTTGLVAAGKQAGLGLHSIGAALDVMTVRGVPAEQAATRLRTTLTMMSSPTGKAQKALAELGMTHDQLAKDMRAHGLAFALQDLQNHLNATFPPGRKLTYEQQREALMKYGQQLEAAGVHGKTLTKDLTIFHGELQKTGSSAIQQSQLITQAFGGSRMGTTMALLVQNMKDVRQHEEELGKPGAARRFAENWKATQKDFTVQAHQFGERVHELGVRVGDFLIPKLKDFVIALIDAGKWLHRHKIILDTLAVLFGTVLVAAIAAFFGRLAMRTVNGIKDIGNFAKEVGKLPGHFKSAVEKSIGFLGGLIKKIRGVKDATVEANAAELTVSEEGAAGGPGGGAPPGEGGLMGEIEGMITGVRGTAAPGSEANPLAVVIMAGERFGLGEQGAGVGEKSGTEMKTEARQATQAGTNQPVVPAGAATAEEEKLAAEQGALSSATQKEVQSTERTLAGAMTNMGNRISNSVSAAVSGLKGSLTSTWQALKGEAAIPQTKVNSDIAKINEAGNRAASHVSQATTSAMEKGGQAAAQAQRSGIAEGGREAATEQRSAIAEGGRTASAEQESAIQSGGAKASGDMEAGAAAGGKKAAADMEAGTATGGKKAAGDIEAAEVAGGEKAAGEIKAGEIEGGGLAAEEEAAGTAAGGAGGGAAAGAAGGAAAGRAGAGAAGGEAAGAGAGILAGGGPLAATGVASAYLLYKMFQSGSGVSNQSFGTGLAAALGPSKETLGGEATGVPSGFHVSKNISDQLSDATGGKNTIVANMSDDVKKLNEQLKSLHTFAGMSGDRMDYLFNEMNKILNEPDTTANQRKGIQTLLDMLGQQRIQKMVDDIQAVKFPKEPMFLKELHDNFSHMAPDAQRQATLTMIELSSTLEREGRLPRGATDKLIKDIEKQYPQMKAYIQSQGEGSMSALQRTFQSRKVVNAVQKQVENIQKTWGDLPGIAQTTGDNVYQNWLSALAAVTKEMHTGSKKSREAAAAEYKKLLAMEGDVTATFITTWNNTFTAIKSATGHGLTDVVSIIKAFVPTMTAAMGSLGGPLRAIFSEFSTVLGPLKGIFQAIKPGTKLPGQQTGGLVPATTGGQFVQVGEGGYDEYVLTTDPKHASRQRGLLGQYLSRAPGVMGRFQAGGIPGVPSADHAIHQASTPIKVDQTTSMNMNRVGAAGDDTSKKLTGAAHSANNVSTSFHSMGNQADLLYKSMQKNMNGIQKVTDEGMKKTHDHTKTRLNDIHKIHKDFEQTATSEFYNTYANPTGGRGSSSSLYHSITSTWDNLKSYTKTRSDDITNINRHSQNAIESDTSNFAKSMIHTHQDMAHNVAAAHVKLAQSSGGILGKMDDATAAGVNKVFDELNKGLQTLNVPQVKFTMDKNAGSVVSSILQGIGGLVPFAQGGMLPGSEYGYGDTMTLVDPLGRPRAKMAGDEAIFNRHQMPFVEAGLQMLGIGGAEDLWRNVSMPHNVGFATGGQLPGFAKGGAVGSAGAGAGGVAGSGYVYPLSGFTLGDVDDGVDAHAAPGTPIGPIGRSKVIGQAGDWYAGQPIMWWQLLEGPKMGAYVYVAEQITGMAAPGSIVEANQAVASFASSGTGIEMGWGTSTQATLRQAQGLPAGRPTPVGQDFENFILGLAHGKITGGGAFGSAAPTWTDIKDVKSGMKATPGKVADAALKKMVDAANKYGRAHAPTGGTGGANLNVLDGPAPKGSLTWRLKAVEETDDLAGNSGGSAFGLPLTGWSAMAWPLGAGNSGAAMDYPRTVHGGTQLYISANGKYIEAPLVDIGAGSQGPEWSSFPELVMGLYPAAARALGLQAGTSPWILDVGRVDRQELHPASGIKLDPALPRNRGGYLPGFAGGGRLPGFQTGGKRPTISHSSRRPYAPLPSSTTTIPGFRPVRVRRGKGGLHPVGGSYSAPSSSKKGGTRAGGKGGTKQVARGHQPISQATADVLKGLGLGSFADDQNLLGKLDQKYSIQENLFNMFDAAGGAGLPLSDLNVLMGIREEEWDILYKEWVALPQAIERIKWDISGLKGHPAHGGHYPESGTHKYTTAKGHPKSHHLKHHPHPGGGVNPGGPMATTTRPWTFQPATGTFKIQNEISSLESEIKKDQDGIKKATRAVATVHHKISGEAMKLADDYGGTLAQMYTNLSALADQHYYLSVERRGLQQQLANIKSTGRPGTPSLSDIVGQVMSGQAEAPTRQGENPEKKSLRRQIAKLNGKEASISHDRQLIERQMHNIRTSLANAQRKLKEQGWAEAWAITLHKWKLQDKVELLKDKLARLKKALKLEQSQIKQEEGALQQLEDWETGGLQGNEAVVNSLGDIGMDLLALYQQGANLPTPYRSSKGQRRPGVDLKTIEDVLTGNPTGTPPKAGLGLTLPPGLVKGVQTATQAFTDFQNFQASRQNLFAQFGSNFVAAGANPFATPGMRGITDTGVPAGQVVPMDTAGLGAGVQYYGAAAAPYGAGPGAPPGGLSRGGYVPRGDPGPGGTTINIENHFAAGPPDPHTWSAGVSHEITAAA